LEKLLHKKIMNFVRNIFGQAVVTFPGAEAIESNIIQFTNSTSLTFQKWGDGNRKPFFLILWRGTRYLMEFDLSRILFQSDGRLTWVLNVPTRELNKENLTSLGYELTELDESIAKEIHEQMALCNGRARKTPNGYILADDEKTSEVIERFLEIVGYTLKTDQQHEMKKNSENEDEDVSALEGQIAESKVLRLRRNRGIVEQRKKIDNYTCKACGFLALVNDRYVVECHHKFPLRKETITEIDHLVCLCPTCHRIAHRRDEPYSVKEIRVHLRSNTNQAVER
jgi:5-methylcytosine-specific restriction endonuclease McrA